MFLVGKNTLEKGNKLVIKKKEFLMVVTSLKANISCLSTLSTFIWLQKSFSSTQMFIHSFITIAEFLLCTRYQAQSCICSSFNSHNSHSLQMLLLVQIFSQKNWDAKLSLKCWYDKFNQKWNWDLNPVFSPVFFPPQYLSYALKWYVNYYYFFIK